MTFRLVLGLLLFVGTVAPAIGASSARDMYAAALTRERSVRAPADGQTVTAEQLRSVIAEYERLARRHPASGYADNALWQAAGLALDLVDRFGDDRERARARKLLEMLVSRYPASSLAPRATARLAELDASTVASGFIRTDPPAGVRLKTHSTESTALATLRAVHRSALGNGVRITLELDAEVPFQSERLNNPQRVFFDFVGTQASPTAIDSSASSDDLVKQIRLGRRPNNTTRVVLDLDKVGRHSVFALYSPFRVVIDFERVDASGAPSGFSRAETDVRPPISAEASAWSPRNAPEPSSREGGKADATAPGAKADAAKEAAPLIARVSTTTTLSSPKAPPSNSLGGFSLARQLGLGISRIVIDAGHGGHDPGAQAHRLAEAELVLDVALRVEKLLVKQPGIEVMMTRRTDVFIPLEERTAIANREGADLFLSIHANASRNSRAHGVETYFLNFASNPEAEAVAARENAASGRTMHSLPDILKAIALNTKLDESRDFAAIVQRMMVARLRTQNRHLRDLGVKQAPFVVLIGAAMPSVLAEISFVTNRAEGALLRTTAYRQRIADALTEAVLRYQRSLKNVGTVAQQ
jgi:N-acetylmuramoyl-L-alanine amidase